MKMHRMRPVAGAIGLIAAAALVLTGCAATPEPTAPTTGDAAESPSALGSPETPSLSVGTLRTQTGSPVFVGAEAGFVADYGFTDIDVQWVDTFAAGTALLLSGDLDITMMSYFPVVAGVNEGIPFRIVAESTVSAPEVFSLETLPDSGIEGPTDLEGKIVAVPGLNTSLDARVKYIVGLNGGDHTKVTFVSLPYGEMAAALELGTVDAALLDGVYRIDVKDKLHSVTVIDSGDLPGFPELAWVTTEEFAAANPNTIASFQCVLESALPIIKNDRKSWDAAVAKYLDTDLATVEKFVVPTYYEGKLGKDEDGLSTVSDLMLSLDMISEPFDFSKVIVAAPESCAL